VGRETFGVRCVCVEYPFLGSVYKLSDHQTKTLEWIWQKRSTEKSGVAVKVLSTKIETTLRHGERCSRAKCRTAHRGNAQCIDTPDVNKIDWVTRLINRVMYGHLMR